MKGNKGQVLLETALVLPLCIATAVIFFKFIFFCRALIVMQHTAADYAQDLATQHKIRPVLEVKARLDWSKYWRAVLPFTYRTSREQLRPWEQWVGVYVVRQPGYAHTVQLNSFSIPNSLIGLIVGRDGFRVYGICPSEAPVPGE